MFVCPMISGLSKDKTSERGARLNCRQTFYGYETELNKYIIVKLSDDTSRVLIS